jgi:hypothetical protein
VRPGIDQASRIANYPENGLTILGAMLGLAALTAALALGRGRAWPRLRAWVVVVLWALPVLAVFVVGRSYHSPYYVQWAPPLALLAGALAAWPVWRALAAARPRRPVVRPVALGGAAIGLLLAPPLLGTQWRASHTVEADRVYLTAGATLAAGLPRDEAQILVFDPGYTFVAGRPPAVLPDGQRLVDSAGAMVYYGTDIDRAPWGELVGRILQFSRERNAQETFYSLSAQATALGALPASAATVIDGKIGEPQLRPQSIQLIQILSFPPEKIDYAHIYRRTPFSGGEHAFFPPTGLELWAGTVEGIRPDGSGEGPELFRSNGEHTLGADNEMVQIGLYWHGPAAFQPVDYRVVLELRNTQGAPVTRTDTRPDEDRAATHSWRPGWIYPDLHNLVLPSGPGRYILAITLYIEGQPTVSEMWEPSLVISRP